MQLSSVLKDIIPAKARKITYLIFALGLLGYSAWEAAHGDFVTFITSFLASVVNALAASNTITSIPVEETPIEPAPITEPDQLPEPEGLF